MWQRFTERARKVVFYAQEAAQKYGEGYVSTEHLLLGLVRDDDSVAARVLGALGVERDRIRREVEAQLPRGDARPAQDMTLTPRGKRVIDLAYHEARELNNNYIGTEHLLLGLIAEGDGLAGRVLANLGVELANARLAVEAIQTCSPVVDKPTDVEPKPLLPPADPWKQFDEAVRRAVDVADEEARIRGRVYVSPEHLLLGLTDEPKSIVTRALVALGIDVDLMREETKRRCRTACDRRPEETIFSPASDKAFQMAYDEQRLRGGTQTSAEHLLFGLLREPDGVAGRVLEEFGVEAARLQEAIRGLDAEA